MEITPKMRPKFSHLSTINSDLKHPEVQIPSKTLQLPSAHKSSMLSVSTPSKPSPAMRRRMKSGSKTIYEFTKKMSRKKEKCRVRSERELREDVNIKNSVLMVDQEVGTDGNERFEMDEKHEMNSLNDNPYLMPNKRNAATQKIADINEAMNELTGESQDVFEIKSPQVIFQHNETKRSNDSTVAKIRLWMKQRKPQDSLPDIQKLHNYLKKQRDKLMYHPSHKRPIIKYKFDITKVNQQIERIRTNFERKRLRKRNLHLDKLPLNQTFGSPKNGIDSSLYLTKNDYSNSFRLNNVNKLHHTLGFDDSNKPQTSYTHSLTLRSEKKVQHARNLSHFRKNLLSNSEFINCAGMKTQRGTRKQSQKFESSSQNRILSDIKNLEADQSLVALNKTLDN